MLSRNTASGISEAKSINRQSSNLIVFCQFSNTMLSSTSEISKKLYKTCYPQMPGYYYRTEFLELPYWINIVNGMLLNETKRVLIIIDQVDEAIEKIQSLRADIVLFSVMNVTELYVLEIIRRCPAQKFVLGGYTNPQIFLPFENATYVQSPVALPASMGIPMDIHRPPDYSLFNNMGKWMPRITLSMGCLHKCRFCAVPRELTEISEKDIIAQSHAFMGLDFDLVYVDDKTFGQAKNYRTLEKVYRLIRNYNTNFLGFVVQTTSSALAANDCSLLSIMINDLGVKYLEIGLETCDDTLLAKLKKPQRMRHVEAICNRIRLLNRTRNFSNRVRLIPNILFGIDGDTYIKTIEFIKNNLDVICTVNYANISAYPDRRDSSFLANLTQSDGDDYDFNKSWLSEAQVEAGKAALNEIVQIFGVKMAENV